MRSAGGAGAGACNREMFYLFSVQRSSRTNTLYLDKDMSYLDIVVDHEVLMLGHELLPPGPGLALDTAHGDGDPVTAPDRLRATDPADTCRLSNTAQAANTQTSQQSEISYHLIIKICVICYFN